MHTLPDLRDQYLENADWDVVNSVAKAKIFVATVRRLLILFPMEGQTGGSGGELFRFDIKLLRDELRRAEEFVAASDPGGVKFFDLSCFRE